MGLLPPPEKRDGIRFLVWKSLPYGPRLWLAASLLAGGLGVQLSLSFGWGLALLAAGTLLGAIGGYDATPKTVPGTEKWAQVTPDEYAKIRLKSRELRRWDEDFFDITSTTGLFGLVGMAGACAAACIAAWTYAGDTSAGRLALDCAVVFLPHWFTGARSYLAKDRLIIKLDLLEAVMRELSSPSDVQVLPMLSTAATKEGKAVPEDARLMLRLLNAPKDFMGVQVQVSINTVQGRDLPYLYCVVLAKEGCDLLPRPGALPRLRTPGKLLSFFGGIPILYEPKRTEGVDVLVVRQRATQTEGYATSQGQALAVVAAGLDIARGVVSAGGGART